MELNEVIKILSKKQNGAYIKVKLCTEMTSRQTADSKKNGNIVVKETLTTVRKGVNYGNIKSVRERLMSQGKTAIDPKTGKETVIVGELPWGKYYKNSKTIIEHKGNYYLRLYTSPNKPKVEYYLNNKKISSDDLRKLDIMQPSYWKNKDSKDSVSAEECMTVKIENIKEIY